MPKVTLADIKAINGIELPAAVASLVVSWFPKYNPGAMSILRYRDLSPMGKQLLEALQSHGWVNIHLLYRHTIQARYIYYYDQPQIDLDDVVAGRLIPEGYSTPTEKVKLIDRAAAIVATTQLQNEVLHQARSTANP